MAKGSKRSEQSELSKPSGDSFFPGRSAIIDLNCDMGEGVGNDELIMPFISSANIACGYHAGDGQTIWRTIELAIKHDVAVGAHVSFLDKQNFGRSEMQLPPAEVYDLITRQLIIIKEIANRFPVKLRHVKPHGALYNMSAKVPGLSKAIAEAVRDFDKNLVLFGLSGSYSVTEAKATGLKTASEVFADRTYQDDGSLTPRTQPGALIEEAEISVRQVLQMIEEATVTTVSGRKIPIVAETICIHGDGQHAAAFAKNISGALKKEGMSISAFG